MDEAASPVVLHGDLDLEWLRRLQGTDAVAVDTETGGLDWRMDRLELVQLHARDCGTVLVRRTGAPMPHLGAVLQDEATVKVFHFAPFDLRFLAQVHEGPVRAVRCTKAASKLLTPEVSPGEHSLAPLLQRHLGVALEKGAVRVSDWGASELSKAQVAYAVRDVEFLLDLFDVMNGLIDRGCLRDLYDEVCAYLPVDAALDVRGFPNPLQY